MKIVSVFCFAAVVFYSTALPAPDDVDEIVPEDKLVTVEAPQNYEYPPYQPDKSDSTQQDLNNVLETQKPVLNGVDVVSYFSLPHPDAPPVYGSITHSHTLITKDGKDDQNYFRNVFYFKNEANKRLFLNNPSQYLPKYGGFCNFGFSSEFPQGGDLGMDDANATQGWPWARDYLGPPADPSVWLINEQGHLQVFFVKDARDNYLKDPNAPLRGDRRWAEFYGNTAAGSTIGPRTTDITGPFNSECPASGYWKYNPKSGYGAERDPHVPTRTCPFLPQQLHGITTRKAITDSCADALDATCSAYRGDVLQLPGGGDDYPPANCRKCLGQNYDYISQYCPNNGTALLAKVAVVYCA